MNHYQSFADQLTFYLSIYITVLILGEAFFSFLLFKKTYKKELMVNLITGGVSIFTVGLFKTYIFSSLFIRVYDYRLFEIGLHWYTWVIGFFAYTFYDYFTHVLYHRVRLFWCFHSVHHSIQHMNSSAGFRASVLDIFSLNIFLLLLPLFGIHPLVYFIIYSIHKFWGMFIHINERFVNKIGFLEYVVVSPSNHHLHHASNPPYIDKNYGEFVPWYDMLFGTYVQEKEKPSYGTVNVQTELSFWDSQLFEFRRLLADMKTAHRLKTKLQYLFNPPGWMPRENTGQKNLLPTSSKEETICTQP
jgi:sterol desaturase/sphingolipid hydroxylase (fatty acid hydroxylase superfamily)